MITGSGHIATNLEMCKKFECHVHCSENCRSCVNCLDPRTIEALHEAYREHLRQGDFKRVFPSQNHFSDELIESFSNENKNSAMWFREKCRENNDWC